MMLGNTGIEPNMFDFLLQIKYFLIALFKHKSLFLRLMFFTFSALASLTLLNVMIGPLFKYLIPEKVVSIIKNIEQYVALTLIFLALFGVFNLIVNMFKDINYPKKPLPNLFDGISKNNLSDIKNDLNNIKNDAKLLAKQEKELLLRDFKNSGIKLKYTKKTKKI